MRPQFAVFGGSEGENIKDECSEPTKKSIPTETHHPVQKIRRCSQKCVLWSLARKVEKKKEK